MPTFIDRRADAKGRSAVNRERFVRRYKKHIRKAVDRMVSERSMRDMEKGGVIDIPARDISEPTFRHKPGDGDIDRVLPGNRHFSEGDRVPRPRGGGGDGSGNQGGDGESADSFQFVLSRDEFMELFFDGLELPRLARSQLGETMSTRTRRAGFTRYSTPANLSLQRTMKMALARRLVLNSACDREEAPLQEQREEANADDDTFRLIALDDALENIHRRRGAIHFLEDIDLRYRARAPVIEPSIRAVMFCLMDVSGSMDEEKKDLAKRFFTLLYLFLTRKYEHVEVVFLRHTDDAEEVGEEAFFHDTKSGGTVVLSALVLMAKLLEQRYADRSWNIYGAQVSDGDAFGEDPGEASRFLTQNLLPMTRYFTYVEAGSTSGGRASPLWAGYESIKDGRLAMRRVAQRADVYPALASLFQKQEAAA
jgi:uncharacterized sporulation protein YeaH/YhbH (DUF444 family)